MKLDLSQHQPIATFAQEDLIRIEEAVTLMTGFVAAIRVKEPHERIHFFRNTLEKLIFDIAFTPKYGIALNDYEGKTVDLNVQPSVEYIKQFLKERLPYLWFTKYLNHKKDVNHVYYVRNNSENYFERMEVIRDTLSMLSTQKDQPAMDPNTELGCINCVHVQAIFLRALYSSIDTLMCMGFLIIPNLSTTKRLRAVQEKFTKVYNDLADLVDSHAVRAVPINLGNIDFNKV